MHLENKLLYYKAHYVIISFFQAPGQNLTYGDVGKKPKSFGSYT